MNVMKSGLMPLVMVSTLLLGACTGDGAAPGSTIVMNPSATDVTYTVSDATQDVCTSITEQIVVNVVSPGVGTGSNGPGGPSGPAGPAGVTDLFITLDLSGQSSEGTGVASLYEDTDGDGTLDESIDALVTGTGSPAYTTTTNAQGVKVLLLKLVTRCVAYKGQMYVFAENKTIVGSYDFDVKQIVEEPPAP